MKKIISVLAFVVAAGVSTSAHAACNSPLGAAGDQIYNSTHNVMQYCNGSNWIAMGSGGASSGGSDTLGDLACATGESIEFDGTNWNCVGGKVSRAGDTMTGTLDVAAPTATTHAATKGYVDAALASVAGAAGGGGGSACYYTNSSCGPGFDAMPGTYEGNNICCTGGGSLIDETPSAFDFPDSPTLAWNVAHTWTPIQMNGFENTSVYIATTPGAGVGEYRICGDAACSNVIKNWRSTSTGISSGNYLQIRIGAHTVLRAANSKISITVGGTTDVANIPSANTGDYYFAFVSSTTSTGNLGGLNGADNRCQNLATAAGYAGTFRAWLSSTSVPALQRFENRNTSSKFLVFNGTATGIKIADSWSDLTDGSLDVAFNRTETGAAAGGRAWTNTDENGNISDGSTGDTCTNWTDATSGYQGGVGDIGSTSYHWTDNGTDENCNNNYRLYCFQTVKPE